MQAPPEALSTAATVKLAAVPAASAGAAPQLRTSPAAEGSGVGGLDVTLAGLAMAASIGGVIFLLMI